MKLNKNAYKKITYFISFLIDFYIKLHIGLLCVCVNILKKY